MWHDGAAVANVAALCIHNDVGAQGYLGMRVGFQCFGDAFQRTGQVLLVTVEVGGYIRIFGHFAPCGVDGIVHAGIFGTFEGKGVIRCIGMGCLPFAEPLSRTVV